MAPAVPMKNQHLRRWERGVRFGTVLAGCALLMLAGVGISGPTSARAPEFPGARMLECSGLPCIELPTARGGHIKLLIDTGNVRSILDSHVATQLGLDLKVFIGRDGKPHPEYQTATIDDVLIGERSIGAVQFLVMDLQPDIKNGSQPQADGSLAYTAFTDRALRLDYKHRRVEVSERLTEGAPCLAACGTITMPTFGKSGPPIVVTTGFSVNGQPIDVQIDTLYTGTLLIYPTAVSRLGLEHQAQSRMQRFFAFTDGGVKMMEGRADMESFHNIILQRRGHLYFATSGVHLPDGMFDGTVGQELFVGHVLTLDFHAHHFWII